FIVALINSMGALAGYALIIILALILIVLFFKNIKEIYKGFLNEDKSGVNILKNKLTSIFKFVKEEIIKNIVIPLSFMISIMFSITTQNLAIKNLAIIIFAILFIKEKDN
ncbi:MAG: hypothetical protein ACOCP8_09970, partial [archaeon]